MSRVLSSFNSWDGLSVAASQGYTRITKVKSRVKMSTITWGVQLMMRLREMEQLFSACCHKCVISIFFRKKIEDS